MLMLIRLSGLLLFYQLGIDFVGQIPNVIHDPRTELSTRKLLFSHISFLPVTGCISPSLIIMSVTSETKTPKTALA